MQFGQHQSRDIKADIVRNLRREVGFVCPVEGCHSPYLSWHHFDPPYAEGHVHNENGMIALCLEHHKAADNGSFTNNQLRQLKANPHRAEKVCGRFLFHRDRLLLFAGVCAEATETIVEVRGQKLLFLTRDERGWMVNLTIPNADGDPIFEMRDNCWTVLPDLFDVSCPPASDRLELWYERRQPFLRLRFVNSVADELVASIAKYLGAKKEDAAVRSRAFEIEEQFGRECAVCFVERFEVEYPVKLQVLNGLIKVKGHTMTHCQSSNDGAFLTIG